MFMGYYYRHRAFLASETLCLQAHMALARHSERQRIQTTGGGVTPGDPSPL